VPDGDQVIQPLIDLMDDADIIVLTRDWHPEDHVSFSAEPEYVDGSWPRHCVRGTSGAEFDGRLFGSAVGTGKPILLVHKGSDADKEAYSGFDGKVVDVFNRYALLPIAPEMLLWDNWKQDLVGLSQALVWLGVASITIGGLALDYCVAATAIDSVRKFHTEVSLPATRPVGFVTGAKAVADMTIHNVRIKG
jgi:nicotinamidase/pyrazinamidase